MKLKRWLLASMASVGILCTSAQAEEHSYSVYKHDQVEVLMSGASSVVFTGVTREELEWAMDCLGVEFSATEQDGCFVLDEITIDVDRFFDALGDVDARDAASDMMRCRAALWDTCEGGCHIAAAFLSAKAMAAAALLGHPILISAGEVVALILSYELHGQCLRCCERGGIWERCIQPVFDEGKRIHKTMERHALHYMEHGCIRADLVGKGRFHMGMPMIGR